MTLLSEKQLEMCEFSQWNFSDLNPLYLSCTLKRLPEMSYAHGIIDSSKAIIEKNGVSIEVLRPVGYDITFGVYSDMTGQGRYSDD